MYQHNDTVHICTHILHGAEGDARICHNMDTEPNADWIICIYCISTFDHQQ